MWNGNFIMKLLWSTYRVIYCRVEDMFKNKWNLLACYGTPYYAEKQTFWENLECSIGDMEGPWLLVRDLNEVISSKEKCGG